MDFPSHMDLVRLDRWIRADGTAEELDSLRHWVEADPRLQALAAGMGRPLDERSWDTSGRWRELQQRIGPPALPARDGFRIGASAKRWFVRVAAVVALVAGGAALWRGYIASQNVVAPTAMREIVTQRGQRFVLALPDSSRVVVAPNSRLRIPLDYQPMSGARHVYLDAGDAFFVVAHNPARPFRVYVANGVLEDLGTEFLVTVRPAIRSMRAVVVSGQVAVWSGREHGAKAPPLFTLSAGQLGELDAAGNASVLANVNAERYVSWVKGVLVFDNTPLDEVVATLQRWYDLDIRLADTTLAARPVTATIHNQSVFGVLESIALSLNLRIERRGTVVTLLPGPR